MRRKEIPGSVEVRHDKSMKQFRTVTQLEPERLYFLSVFTDDTTGAVKKYSLDVEKACDSHYEFGEQQKKKIRQEAENTLRPKWWWKKANFSHLLIAYIKKNGGASVERLVSRYATAQFHYD